ncbi:MAG: hypothetical protein KAV82_01650 [Phycisphaerae bacterium]|nr:hypothetical protein [Phycisphaerae bacterium]
MPWKPSEKFSRRKSAVGAFLLWFGVVIVLCSCEQAGAICEKCFGPLEAALFADCMANAEFTPDPPWPTSTSECVHLFDYDKDGDVDLADAQILQVRFCIPAVCDDDEDCEDDVFCNGSEVCVGGFCQRGVPPCAGQICDEIGGECIACDDGDFCNGVETYVEGACVAGVNPCPLRVCNEVNDRCEGLLCDEPDGPFWDSEAVGVVQSEAINEASGMAASRRNVDVLWVHNDWGDDDHLFAINVSGDLLGTYELGVEVWDAEDIAIGPGPMDDTSYLYLGDIGDNDSMRSSIFVIRIPEPVVDCDQEPVYVALADVERIELRYPTGANAPSYKDAETLLVDPLNGDIYVLTKRMPASKVYRAAYPHSTTTPVTMEFIANLPWGVVTGGDISPDGDFIIIRRYSYSNPQGAVWYRPPGAGLAEVFGGESCPLALQTEPQGEAICWAPEGLAYYTLSEGLHQPVWHFARD